MAIVVTHKEYEGQFILVGAGYGAVKATRPSLFFGNLAPTEETGEHSLVLLCRDDGRVGWVDSSGVRVVSVDGQSPAAILSGR